MAGLSEFFGEPITPSGRTLGEILVRKGVKQSLRQFLGIDDTGQKKGKRAMEQVNPVLAKLAFLNLAAKLAELEKEAPFKSEAQRRKFHAMKSRGEISSATVKKWESHTPKGKLPERVHKKSAGEKGAGALARLAGKGLLTTFFPITMVGSGIVGGLRTPGPTERLRRTSLRSMAEELVSLTKTSLEEREHAPMSTDAAEPPVKKNALSKSSALVFPGVTARATSAATRGPGSPSNPGTAWLKRSTTKPEHHAKLEGPPERQESSFTREQRTIQASGGAHVVRPTI
jgi:hypothetical protein